jgi:hypothetical protein
VRATTFDDFGRAVRGKLVREISAAEGRHTLA